MAFTLLVCDTDTYAYLLPTQITAAVIAYGTETFSTADYPKAGWVCILIAMAYGLLVMAPWYALLRMPVWNPAAPWASTGGAGRFNLPPARFCNYPQTPAIFARYGNMKKRDWRYF